MSQYGHSSAAATAWSDRRTQVALASEFGESGGGTNSNPSGMSWTVPGSICWYTTSREPFGVS